MYDIKILDSIEHSLIWADLESDVQYHVFALTLTNKGTVLAFSEGRFKKWTADAEAPHHITMKRSEDNGKTWSENIILLDAFKNPCFDTENLYEGSTKPGHCYTNPVPVVDENTGRITLVYADNYENAYSKVYTISSIDDGVTWTEPVEITDVFADDPHKRTLHLPGPGHGIQLKKGKYAGRLVVEVWHRQTIELPVEDRCYGISVIYSDDGGLSWKSSEYIHMMDRMNEARIAEGSDGNVIMNSRTFLDCRLKVLSADGGHTWSKPTKWESIGNSCMCDSGFLTFNHGDKTYMAISHPEGEKRNNTTILISDDDGKTWISRTQIYDKGRQGYTDLVYMKNGKLGVLFSMEDLSIHFTSFDLDIFLK